MGALFSFLGGSVFRMIWGEISHWLTAKQEHKQEMARLAQQEQFAAAQHARNLEAIRVQSDLGIKTVQVQAEADLSRIDASAWGQAVADVGKQSGIKWLDAWNGSIRPAVATWSLVVLSLSGLDLMVMSAIMVEVAGAALGIYLAERGLFKRGKL